MKGKEEDGDAKEIVTNVHEHQSNQRVDGEIGRNVVGFPINQEGILDNSNKQLDTPTQDGIIISKKKRQRIIENNMDLGQLSNSDTGLAIEMGDEEQHNQKNLALAGPVIQARPPQ